MNNPAFVYTTYIKTTPEKLWAAINIRGLKGWFQDANWS